MNNVFYDLYENNKFTKRTSDRDYAIFWILDNFIKSEYTTDYHFDIVKMITDNDIMCSESIKIYDNKVIKINKYNNSLNTTYSPFDLDLFNLTELSLLYQNIINRNETNIINKPLINNKKLENELNKAQQNLKSKELQKQENKTEVQTFNTEELEDMKNLLNSLKNKKEFIDKEFKEKENELADIDCNERFENKKQKLEEERNKEKYNIFKSDIKIYYKLIEEDNFSENFIPPLFEAKYFILKYLFINDYFMDENKTEPSEEIFELYRTLYDFVSGVYTNNDSIYETFSDIFNEFNEFLPKDKKLLTDRQMMDTLNAKSQTIDLFNETTGFEGKETNTDTDTDYTTDNE